MARMGVHCCNEPLGAMVGPSKTPSRVTGGYPGFNVPMEEDSPPELTFRDLPPLESDGTDPFHSSFDDGFVDSDDDFDDGFQGF